jgi:hypothetical protein
MPKEWRYNKSGLSSLIYFQCPPANELLGVLMERDVSEWRPASSDSEVLSKLRYLRGLEKSALECELGVNFSCSGNVYEMDTAILFYLIQIHGTSKVKYAVRELLGVSPNADLMVERTK